MSGPNPAVVSATHEILFAIDTATHCDVCGVEIAPGDDDALAGKGVYMTARGDELRFDDAPLCATCATAIGMTALMRAEIEEDEG